MGLSGPGKARLAVAIQCFQSLNSRQPSRERPAGTLPLRLNGEDEVVAFAFAEEEVFAKKQIVGGEGALVV